MGGGQILTLASLIIFSKTIEPEKTESCVEASSGSEPESHIILVFFQHHHQILESNAIYSVANFEYSLDSTHRRSH